MKRNSKNNFPTHRLWSILAWSAISAAFIGPGTVTTAAKAGAGFGLSLLWALFFSTVACLALQEASARLTIATGKPLARALGDLFGKGLAGRLLPVAIVIAVVVGCAAYQAGNILGAVAGVGLGLNLNPQVVTLSVSLIAGIILFLGSASLVARVLGVGVALMGLAFFACAIDLAPALPDLVQGCLVPSLPAGAGLLALGLVGTTVVPYNLFLGSGLAVGQTMGQARLGLAIAIPLGGIISMAVLVVGTAVAGDFSFATLAGELDGHLGGRAGKLFAFGLFAAGLSSAITAPLAAALSVRGVLARGDQPEKWQTRAWRYRAVWGGILLFGLCFGLTRVKPIPIIIMAQALNGMLLPLVALYLWLAVNDRRLMGRMVAGFFANLGLFFSVLLAFLLGISGIIRTAFQILGFTAPGETVLLITAGVVVLILGIPIGLSLRARRRAENQS